MTPQQDDYLNILAAFQVKRFSSDIGGLRVVLQINRPEHKDLYYSGQERARLSDQILCIQELKLQLMAKSAICPGLITIIWSLITSNSTGLHDIEEVSNELIEFVNKEDKNVSNALGTGGAGNPVVTNASITQEVRNVRYLDQIAKWQFNYLTGMKYEMYRVPLKQEKFAGLKFREVCMILYYKLNMTLIGLEVRVGNQTKVFVNPAEYVFNDNDHWAYVMYHRKPNNAEIDKLDLQISATENFYIMHYLKRRDYSNSKKEFMQKHSTLARMYDEIEKGH